MMKIKIDDLQLIDGWNDPSAPKRQIELATGIHTSIYYNHSYNVLNRVGTMLRRVLHNYMAQLLHER